MWYRGTTKLAYTYNLRNSMSFSDFVRLIRGVRAQLGQKWLDIVTFLSGLRQSKSCARAASYGRVKDTVMSRAPNHDRLSQAKLVCYNILRKLCTALSLLFQYSYSKFCTAFLNHSKSVLFDIMKLGGVKYKMISKKLEI